MPKSARQRAGSVAQPYGLGNRCFITYNQRLKDLVLQICCVR